MAYDYEKSIRPGKLPHIWCPGCGHGIVMKGLIRAMDTCGLDRKNTAIVSGIGCASRLPATSTPAPCIPPTAVLRPSPPA